MQVAAVWHVRRSEIDKVCIAIGLVDDIVVERINSMLPLAFIRCRDILRVYHPGIDIQHGTCQEVTVFAMSCPQSDVVRETAVKQTYLIEGMNRTGIEFPHQVVRQYLPEMLIILRGCHHNTIAPGFVGGIPAVTLPSDGLGGDDR